MCSSLCCSLLGGLFSQNMHLKRHGHAMCTFCFYRPNLTHDVCRDLASVVGSVFGLPKHVLRNKTIQILVNHMMSVGTFSIHRNLIVHIAEETSMILR